MGVLSCVTYWYGICLVDVFQSRFEHGELALCMGSKRVSIAFFPLSARFCLVFPHSRRMKGNSRPFGGVQLVLCGDFFQLPPVGIGRGSTKFCFQAKTWDSSLDQSIVLKQVRHCCARVCTPALDRNAWLACVRVVCDGLRAGRTIEAKC